MTDTTAKEVRFYTGAVGVGSGALLLSFVVSRSEDVLLLFLFGGLFLASAMVFGMTFSGRGRRRLLELYSGFGHPFR
jgi:hypothetical protein